MMMRARIASPLQMISMPSALSAALYAHWRNCVLRSIGRLSRGHRFARVWA